MLLSFGRGALGALSMSVFLSACGSPVVYNEGNQFALKSNSFEQGRRAYSFLNFALTERSPQLKPDLIVLTLSGGGLRAAALAAATMNELHQFTIRGAPITDNIVLVSSTSGGSLAAGYVAVHGFDHYREFRANFLEKPNTTDLFRRGIGPRLFYDRSAVFLAFLEERLGFNSMTFGDLIRRNDRPFFVMNATDLSSGESFAFIQNNLSNICTNLSPIPISVGVTASSAIPFLLTDVELKNRSNECGSGLQNMASPNF